MRYDLLRAAKLLMSADSYVCPESIAACGPFRNSTLEATVPLPPRSERRNRRKALATQGDAHAKAAVGAMRTLLSQARTEAAGQPVTIAELWEDADGSPVTRTTLTLRWAIGAPVAEAV